MGSNYHIAYNKGWDDLARKIPEEVSAFMGVAYLKEKRQFIVPHLNETYIVDCTDKTIVNEKDGSAAGLELSILILHYLTYFTEKKNIENRWVSLKEIPNGGDLFYPAFHKESIVGLAKAFGRHSEQLLACAEKLGGHVGFFGTTSAFFAVFPRICLCVVIWEQDDEVPANATMLFDPSISYYLHIESIIGVGGYLAKRLIRLACPDEEYGHDI